MVELDLCPDTGRPAAQKEAKSLAALGVCGLLCCAGSVIFSASAGICHMWLFSASVFLRMRCLFDSRVEVVLIVLLCCS